MYQKMRPDNAIRAFPSLDGTEPPSPLCDPGWWVAPAPLESFLAPWRLDYEPTTHYPTDLPGGTKLHP